MGRYTTVQIYTDSNPSMRNVSYDQAVGSGKKAGSDDKPKPVQSEKVDNPSGSNAGAGSGEFHVYRACRARERERLKALDKREKQRLEEEEFRRIRIENERTERIKTEKRKRKRMREKEAKNRRKNMKLNGILPQPPKNNNANDVEDVTGNDDFEPYIPSTSTKALDEESEGVILETETNQNLPNIEVKNDGSFLETVKKTLGKLSGNEPALSEKISS